MRISYRVLLVNDFENKYADITDIVSEDLEDVPDGSALLVRTIEKYKELSDSSRYICFPEAYGWKNINDLIVHGEGDTFIGLLNVKGG